MPAIGYSDKAIGAIEDPTPPQRRVDYSVKAVPGLWISAYATGKRSWFLRYQLDGTRRKMVLGDYPGMSMADAADEARSLRRTYIKAGIDPKGELAEVKTGTFADLCDLYMEAAGKGAGRLAASTLEERRRQLGLPELAAIRKKHPSEITDVDIGEVLAQFEDRGAGVMTNRVHQTLGVVFEWARIRKELKSGITENHARRSPRRFGEAPRDRALTPDEIKLAWTDLEDRPPLTRSALRLALLTGQRTGEIRRLRLDYIHGTTLKMPAGYRKRTKADRGRPAKPHNVHLASLAMAELDSIRAYARNGFVFPQRSTGNRPMPKDILVSAVASMVTRLGMEPWTPHDLRRTARTRWSEDLHADFVVAEKIIGHKLPRILETYDRSVRWEERVQLLDRWSDHLAILVTPR